MKNKLEEAYKFILDNSGELETYNDLKLSCSGRNALV